MHGRIYVIRVLFTAIALVMLAVGDAVCNAGPVGHNWIFLAGAIYPHLDHLLLGRLDPRHRRSHVIFLVDGLFVGAVIAALNLAVVPTAVLATINLFNWMIIGGPALIALGLTAMLVGVAIAGPGAAGMLSGSAVCAPMDLLASAVLIGYFLVVGRVIYLLVGELRLQQAGYQSDSDAALHARTLAERTLLAVLPPSAAQELREKGEVAPARHDDATVLFVEFDWGGHSSPSIGEMTDTFHVCDMILARHGFESIKTFGGRVLAMSRSESGPNDAVAAAREIGNHFADHRTLAGARDTRRSVRVVMHCGPITTGLVQPSRLNLELLGETIDSLAALAAAADPSAAVIASVAAQRRLRDAAGFVPEPGADRVPPHYRLAPETTA